MHRRRGWGGGGKGGGVYVLALEGKRRVLQQFLSHSDWWWKSDGILKEVCLFPEGWTFFYSLYIFTAYCYCLPKSSQRGKERKRGGGGGGLVGGCTWNIAMLVGSTAVITASEGISHLAPQLGEVFSSLVGFPSDTPQRERSENRSRRSSTANSSDIGTVLSPSSSPAGSAVRRGRGAGSAQPTDSRRPCHPFGSPRWG